MVDCVSVEKEYGRGFFLPRGILTFAFRIIYCYTYRLFYAGRSDISDDETLELTEEEVTVTE